MQECPACMNDRLFAIGARAISRRTAFVFSVVATALLIEGGAVVSSLVSSRVMTWPAVFIGATIRLLVLHTTWPILRHAQHADMPAWKEVGLNLLQVVASGFAGVGTQQLLNQL